MTRNRNRSRGFTLLEVLLVLVIAAIIIAAMSAAMNTQARLDDTARGEVEQAQLARALMQRIADDLRNVVRPFELPAGGVGSSSGGGSGSNSGGTGGNSGGTTAADSATITNIGGPGTSGITDLSGSGTSGSGTGGSSAGRSSGFQSSGAAMGGNSGTQAANSISSGISGMSEEEKIAGVAAPTPGLIGTQYQLQMDVSRLPSIDQFGAVANVAPSTGAASIGPTSDLRTITYYVATNYVNTAAASNAATTSQGGLVVRQLDRAVNSYLTNYGGAGELGQYERVLAPEVTALEFRYFDGTEWTVEWDSESRLALPVAIEILLTVRPSSVDQAQAATWLMTGEAQPQGTTYRMIVNLPTAEPSTAADAALTEATP